MDFTPIRVQKVYEDIIEQFKNMIYSGQLQKGDKLPPERELCQMLDVSRASMREALRAMEVMGIVDSRPGEGTYIVDEITSSMFKPLSLIIALEKNQADFIELRKILESACAKRAAEMRSDEDLEKMQSQIKIMMESDDEGRRAEADKKLHRIISEATGNKLLIDMVEVIADGIDAYIKDARKRLMQDPRNVDALLQQHIAICNHIKNKDGQAAAREMEMHIDFVEEKLKRL
ncbi:MAG: FadR family transcriptional regulator [Tepidanaerobacter acetatoxydans]|jgi:GntR family transcriptional repressor for pyruvate dehydrogenase complex|uniref:FadR/GntR family transcriptional regulator n=1 Tax=Tepidanaerobacter TaxID=499228 RepID=UPI000B33A99B|nr:MULTISPECIES: FadR/GntR family transcriptional regulator [Tepidanaerobacter]NLU09727.1 FadR family transcriptional regulator [Tepidanaerobacter acetatoxydans]